MRWGKLAFLLLLVAGALSPEAAAQEPTLKVNQTSYGYYRVCISIEGARAMQEMGSQTVTQNNPSMYGDFLRSQTECAIDTFEVEVIQEAPAFSGKLRSTALSEKFPVGSRHTAQLGIMRITQNPTARSSLFWSRPLNRT